MSQIILDSANDLIQGDFDNATLSQRTRLQTSTINATTGVYVVPNGTANAASVQISNAADPTNASKVVLATNGSTDTQIISGANGSGTYLPLSIYTNNDIRLQVNNSGALGVRTGPGTVGFGTTGQVLTSNGSGAGVSWNTAAAGGFSNMQVFTSPGTFTTPASTTQIKVTVVGGGGGGAGSGNTSSFAGAGGGGGGTAIYVGPVTASTPYAITVGGGGGSGSSGGTSSFGSLASATGGAGSGATDFPSGNGGAGSAGTLLFRGGGGSGGSRGITGGSGTGAGGIGGNSFLGGTSAATGGPANAPNAGQPGNSYGGGGGGAYILSPGTTGGNSGGSGAAGVVVVEW